ncbi:unnamed protein product, partial [Urochloa humidicola]
WPFLSIYSPSLCSYQTAVTPRRRRAMPLLIPPEVAARNEGKSKAMAVDFAYM